jgi:predicted  nucleic acid-binding Zn-ribbon protein
MIRELFQKVKRKSEQRAGDAFSQYWTGIVARLAAGEELDPEAVVAAAESVGRDASAVESDVDLFRRRQQMAEELRQVPKWQTESVKLQATIDRAAAELREHQQRLQTIIDSAYATKMQVEARIDGTRSHETDLARTCPNPSLASRAQELSEQRKELLARRQPLIESLGKGQGSLGGALEHAESQLEDFSDLASRGDDDARRYIARLKETIQSYQTRIKQSQQQLSDIDEQIARLDRELSEVRQQKLIP